MYHWHLDYPSKGCLEKTIFQWVAEQKSLRSPGLYDRYWHVECIRLEFSDENEDFHVEKVDCLNSLTNQASHVGVIAKHLFSMCFVWSMCSNFRDIVHIQYANCFLMLTGFLKACANFSCLILIWSSVVLNWRLIKSARIPRVVKAFNHELLSCRVSVR